ncbi:MAG: hypothetical protein PHX13_10410 [Thiovulaceae bacterium]|nr:hypothetical protein [Sulfurimonadaceae bacterium]
MDMEHRMLVALAILLVLVSIYLNDFTGVLFFILFFGFFKIVLMNPKYESLRERFESLF